MSTFLGQPPVARWYSSTVSATATASAEPYQERSVMLELTEAFRFLWEIRLRHQAAQVGAGEAPDDFVDPATLGPIAIHPLEPANSPTLRTGVKHGSHRIQGISDDFVPAIVELGSLGPIVDGLRSTRE